MNKEIYTISNNNEVNDEKSLKKSALTKEVWSHELQFLMSCIAMSVGLGNIWRFPFTAYQNGGGAFLIPYLIVLILVGRPIYYLEMCLGQFTAKGNVKLFEAMAPALRGIGYSQITGTICIATYYCSLLSLSLFYFINSFTGDLPWSYCRDEWEAENFLKNVTCIPSNSNGNSTLNGITSSELYFRREVLKEKINIDDGIGLPEWRLVLCLVFVWCCIFIISRNGIQSTGKASYFLALFPYVVILALLIRSVTLEGATDGLVYLFKPNWDKLIEPEVWYAAATQCFFSLNVGVGTITAYASYNGFRHNIYRDVNIITTLDTFTSLIAGSTIFGILGNLANKLNVDVSEVINTGGTGLAFISYPEAIARFDAVPWLFSLLFFFMLFLVGLGCLVSMQACVYTAVVENFPNLTRWKVVLGISICGFLIGLVYLTPGGQFILTLVDHFGGTFITFLSNIMLITIVSWFYGLEKFCINIEFMLKKRVGVYWRLSWGVLTPAVLLAIFIYFVATMETLKHEGKEFPTIALVCGWLIVGLALLQIFLWWVRYLWINKNLGLNESVKKSFSDKDFVPNDEEIHREWDDVKQERLQKLKSVTRKVYVLHLLMGKKIK
ncbi:sodium-dependent nutrient amino acid transporter 1-like isoform X4 [Onthophagus taurus]|uniref:sodium-dependent nutrient amino acid transporter 1-like isoform X4 n=1 Tax=Onthophagus taurus TaxID=166361 RepID=UPI000C20E179|nr:sodium-dependent nutrient amino acid transporter 1-like isoform X3 [Onthophagus taurus]